MSFIDTIERTMLDYERDFGAPPAFIVIGHQDEKQVLHDWNSKRPFSPALNMTVDGAEIMGVPIVVSSMNASGVLAIDGNVWAHMVAGGMLK